MSVSIYDPAWVQLVFEGKNQAYGAYVLRQQHTRTSMAALLLGVGGLSIGAAILTFWPTTHQAMVRPEGKPIVVQRVVFEPPKTKAAPAPRQATAATSGPSTPRPIYVPVATTEVPPLAAEPELPHNTTGAGTAMTEGPSVIGTGQTQVISGANTPVETAPSTPDQGQLMADIAPQFPGGLSAFYQQLQRKLGHPDLEQTVQLIVKFTVLPDGRMSHFVVVRDPGYGLAEQVVGVLQSIETRWQPGQWHGKPIACSYTLPFVFRSNE